MSVETPPQKTPPSAPPERPDGGESLIDQRLRQTGRDLRWVDAAVGLLTLAIGAIAYLFALALADHWLFVGGLGATARFAAWAVLLIVGGGYLFTQIVRPLLWRINPVYVAQTIEQSRPSLKNSLINFLLLRRERVAVPAAITHEIERRTTDELTHVAPDAAVDRHHAIVLAYTLVGLLAVGGLYHVLSPKSPLTSALRVAMPWSRIGSPTRVVFDDIQPGDADAFQGQHLTVSVKATGLDEGEPVMLRFTTGDGQSVDQGIPMNLAPGGFRHEATLPPDRFGLRQNVTYHLAAGDARSRVFSVVVETPPTIVVESVRYDYPAYTELAARTVDRQGDLRAIEGTEVTIVGKANVPIERAEIDPGCKGLRGVSMTHDDRTATGRLTLRMDRDNPGRPQYDCYQLRFTDAAGRENPRPIRHEIQVTADLPPTVELVDPPDQRIQLPANGVLPLRVRAEDPDYALREVGIRAVRGERSLAIRPLLQAAPPSPGHKGPFEAVYRLEPSRLGLKPGDEVMYWAEAKDNKTPLPGHAETERRWITIVEPDPNQQPQPQEQPDDQPQPGDQQKQDQPQPGEDQKQDQPQPGEDQKQDQPQPGDEQKQDQPQPGEDQKQDQPQPGDQQQQDQPQPGDEQKQDQPQPGAEQKQDQPQPGDQQKQDQSQPGDQQKQDQPQPGQDQRQTGAGQQQGGDESSEPIDGETNPGDVIQKALDQREKDQREAKSAGEPADEPTDQQEEPSEGTADEKPDDKKEGRQGKSGGESEEKEPSEDQEQKGQGRESKKDSTEKPEGKPDQTTSDATEPKPGEPKDATDKKSDDPGEGQRGDESETKPETPSPDRSAKESDDRREGRAGERDEKQPPEPKEAKPGDRPDDKPGDRPEGKPESEPQPGEQAKEGENGRPLKPDEVNPNQKGTPEGTTDKDPNAVGAAAKAPGGGGKPGETPPPTEPGEPGEDPFNREYAKKQTVMALEYLKDQLAKEKPDPKLLDSLGGWNREQLQEFVDRWDSMFRRAEQQGPKGQAARDQLDEAIKSLGLRPGRTDLRGGTTKDASRGLRGSRDLKPPPGWEEQIDAYRRSVGRE